MRTIRPMMPFIAMLMVAMGIYYPVLTDDRIVCPVGLIYKSAVPRAVGIATNDYQDYDCGPGDALWYFFPHHIHLWRTLSQGTIPHWDPYSACGHPFLAESEPAVLYPLKWLFLPVEAHTAFSLLIIAHLLLREFGMYLLLRLYAVRPLLAATGGIAFGLSGYFTVWVGTHSMVHTVSWLPWLLAVYRLAHRRQSLIPAMVGAVLVATQFSAGHTHMAMYNCVGLFLFGLTAILQSPAALRRRALAALLLMLVGGTLLALPQLLPTALLYQESWRANRDETVTSPLSRLMLFFLPTAFGNQDDYQGPLNYVEGASFISVTLLFFAVHALFQRRRKSLPFIAVLIGGALLSYSDTFNHLLHAVVPFARRLHHYRAHTLVMFAAIVLGCLALNRETGRNWLRRLLLFAGGFLFLALVYSAGRQPRDLMAPLVPLGMVTLSIKVGMRCRRDWLHAVAAACIVFELLLYAVPQISFAPRAAFDQLAEFPAQIGRLAGRYRIRQLGEGPLFLGARLWNELYGVSGYLTFERTRYRTLRDAMENGRDRHDSLTRFNHLVGVRYLISTDSLPLPAGYRGQGGTTIYRDDNVLARPALYYRALRADDTTALTLLASDTFDFRSVLLLASDAPVRDDRSGTGSAYLATYADNAVSIEVTSTAPGWLFLSDSYHPFWDARVNNEPAPLVRAHYHFRAVPIPAGASRVTMSYEAHGFRLGLLMMAVTLAWFVGLLFTSRPPVRTPRDSSG